MTKVVLSENDEVKEPSHSEKHHDQTKETTIMTKSRS